MSYSCHEDYGGLQKIFAGSRPAESSPQISWCLAIGLSAREDILDLLLSLSILDVMSYGKSPQAPRRRTLRVGFGEW
jgi:hypothetical protein